MDFIWDFYEFLPKKCTGFVRVMYPSHTQTHKHTHKHTHTNSHTNSHTNTHTHMDLNEEYWQSNAEIYGYPSDSLMCFCVPAAEVCRFIFTTISTSKHAAVGMCDVKKFRWEVFIRKI